MTDSSSSSSNSSTSVNSILETSLKLCRCIEEGLISNPNSDGTLDWDAITAKIKATGGTTMSKSELQIVWKYIAYGRKPSDPESTVCDSDGEEPFYQPFSAVKRFRAYTTAQSSKPKDGTTVAQGQHCLSSTIPSAMKAEVLGRNIKIDIPKHVVQGLVGIQPPIYLSAAETSSVPRAQGKPLRVPRVTLLVAQENESFAQALMPVAVNTSYSRPAGVPAYPQLGLPAGTTTARPVAPTYTPAGGAARPAPSVYQPLSGVRAGPPAQTSLGGVKPTAPSQAPVTHRPGFAPGSSAPGAGGATSSSAVKPAASTLAGQVGNRFVPSVVGVKRPAPAGPVPPATTAPSAGAYASTGAAAQQAATASSSGSSVSPAFAPSVHTMPPGLNILPASAVISSAGHAPGPGAAPQPGSGLPPAGMQRTGANSAVITRPNIVPGQRAIFVAPGGSVNPAVANLRKLPNASFPVSYPRGYPPQPPLPPATLLPVNPYALSYTLPQPAPGAPVPIMHAEAVPSAAMSLSGPVPAQQSGATAQLGEAALREDSAPLAAPQNEL